MRGPKTILSRISGIESRMHKTIFFKMIAIDSSKIVLPENSFGRKLGAFSTPVKDVVSENVTIGARSAPKMFSGRVFEEFPGNPGKYFVKSRVFETRKSFLKKTIFFSNAEN